MNVYSYIVYRSTDYSGYGGLPVNGTSLPEIGLDINNEVF